MIILQKNHGFQSIKNLFRTKVFNDLYRKVKNILLNIEEFKTKVKNVYIKSNADEIVKLYKFIGGDRK